MRGWLLLTALLLAAPAQAEDASKLAIGSEAPPFTLKTLGGQKPITLRDYVGKSPREPKKAVLLSFAASYCEPCKKELAELVHLVPEWEKKGVLTVVVLIDTDAEDIAKMQRFIEAELKASYPVLADRFNILARRYRAELLPYAVLVDAAGNVHWVSSGYDLKALQAAVLGLARG